MKSARNIRRTVQVDIGQCNWSLQNGWVYPCAAALGQLMEAEEHNVISDSWRKYVDVARAEAFIEDDIGLLQRDWEKDLRYLRGILASERRLEYEEVMLVLARRSTLQSSMRFLSSIPSDELGDVDNLLSEVLEKNSAYANECRRRTAGMGPLLPEHWWWRTNWPGKSK